MRASSIGEQRLVLELVAQPPVETLDERVLLRFAALIYCQSMPLALLRPPLV
jgi:hypothetical protein